MQITESTRSHSSSLRVTTAWSCPAPTTASSSRVCWTRRSWRTWWMLKSTWCPTHSTSHHWHTLPAHAWTPTRFFFSFLLRISKYFIGWVYISLSLTISYRIKRDINIKKRWSITVSNSLTAYFTGLLITLKKLVAAVTKDQEEEHVS